MEKTIFYLLHDNAYMYFYCMKALSFRSLRQRIRIIVPVTLFRVAGLGKLENPLRPLRANVTSGRQRRARIAARTQSRRTATDLSHNRT